MARASIANAEEFGILVSGETRRGIQRKRRHHTRENSPYPGYEHLTMEMHVERIEPESYFAYRWHPYAVDPSVDYSSEPTTLVQIRLERYVTVAP